MTKLRRQWWGGGSKLSSSTDSSSVTSGAAVNIPPNNSNLQNGAHLTLAISHVMLWATVRQAANSSLRREYNNA
jgi:hypothetical protein